VGDFEVGFSDSDGVASEIPLLKNYLSNLERLNFLETVSGGQFKWGTFLNDWPPPVNQGDSFLW